MRLITLTPLAALNLPVETGPFASAAKDMQSHRLAVMPVGGEDGKTPLIKGFTTWRGPPAAKAVTNWALRFASANIGISCGPSGLAVVDVDDANLFERVIAACGDTPLIVRTGRGFHCYYRDVRGLSSASLRPHGLNIDIKAKGGFVVAPPSLIPGRAEPYRFQRGDWTAVKDLPTLTEDALARLVGGHISGAHASRLDAPRSESGRVAEGNRNNALFSHLRACAPYMTFDDVVEEAREFNVHQTVEPMPDAKVVSTATSVWDMQKRGEIKVPGRGFMRISHHEHDLLKSKGGKDYATALALLVELRRAHGAGQAAAIAFAVVADAMAEQNVIVGVRDPKRISRARRVLQNCGLLIEVAPARSILGGTRKPALYLLGRPMPPTSVAPNAENGACDKP